MFEVKTSKIVIEYGQEIPQPQTADKPRGIMRKSHTTITRHQEDKQSKATSSLFPIKMIAKLEWTQRNAQQTESRNGSNNQQRINNNRTTALDWTAAKAAGGVNAFSRFCCC